MVISGGDIILSSDVIFSIVFFALLVLETAFLYQIPYNLKQENTMKAAICSLVFCVINVFVMLSIFFLLLQSGMICKN